MQTIQRGVNLGGWLVSERWITPSLYAGTEAADERALSQTADGAARLARHHAKFITEADFAWLAAQGITAVRLPVGYWLFGDAPPFLAGAHYVQQCLDWAQRHGLQVLLCLHGAPGSQNGKIHSGQAGAIGWGTGDTVAQTLVWLERVVQTYGNAPALWGIELLNEPSPELPYDQVSWYYRQAFSLITARHPHVQVIMSDGFQPGRWRHMLASRALMDTHQYQLFTANDRRRSVAEHVGYTRLITQVVLWRMRWHHAVVVGEWSLALDAASLRGVADKDRPSAYRQYASAQLAAYERCVGWFYWTYKTEDSGPWNFRASLEAGLLPGPW